MSDHVADQHGESHNAQFHEPFVAPGHTYTSITEKISNMVLNQQTPRGWFIGVAITLILVGMLFSAVTYLMFKGLGIWGINTPVGWGFAIINFVWWIGIGHAGTLISAILLLMRQEWRTSINRFAEAMTLFAVACAGVFPTIHLGRPWIAYWFAPYPNTMSVFPQFRSPLMWDVFAISTYGLVSLMFWYVGLIPDLGTLRDRAQKQWQRYLFGIFSLGWRGSIRHWSRYETTYLLLAGISTPLVLSVHTIVSFDFAVSLIPGWHTTIFPPYFVAGAIYAGFAMVLTLAIPLRKFYGLEDMITMHHLENMGKITLVTGMMVSYGYAMEAFVAWYSGNPYERFMILNRMGGPYSFLYWALIACNAVVPQILWSKRMRTNTTVLFLVSLVVGVGMWLERFIIVITSLHRDFLPSSWDMYIPTRWDWMTYVGTIGFFLLLMLLFVRFLPAISMSEMKMIVPKPQKEESAG